jgi:hypothetical protein
MGYASVPFSKPDVDPGWLKFLNAARNDQISSGWDKVIASWDPAPKKYYEVVDMLVFLMANNPGVKNRLKAYPPFLSLGERQEFKDMLGDKDYMNLIKVETCLFDIVQHEKSIGFLNNTDLWQEVAKLDLADFRKFLMTSKSEKYDSYQLLGRWQLEPESIAYKVRKRKPDVTPAEWAMFRGSLAVVAANTKLKATTDNKLEINITGSLPDPNQITIVKATNATQRPMIMMTDPNNPNAGPRVTGNLGSSGMSGMSPELRARYGLSAPRGGARPGGSGPDMQGQPADPSNPDQATAPPAPKIETKTFQGSWEGEGDYYKITLTNDKGKTETVDASISEDLLSFDAFGYNFVFERYYN